MDKMLKIRAPKYWALWGLLAVYLAFSFFDLQTSAQTGNGGLDRGKAHYMLIVLAVYLAIYIFLEMWKKHFKMTKPDWILTILILLALWIFLVDVICSAAFMSAAIQLNMSFLWIFSFCFFSNYAQKLSGDSRAMLRFCTCILGFFCIAEVYYMIYMMAKFNRWPVLNLAYNIVAMVPWFSLIPNCNKKLVYSVAVIAAVTSMKRGAIIAIVAMLIVDTWATGKVQKKSAKTLVILIAAIGALGAVFLIADNITGGFLSARFSEEQMSGGSGRTDMWKIALDSIGNRNPIEFMLGGGNGSSVALLGTGVHNEWLEFLFSFGAIGVILYLLLIVSFAKRALVMFNIAPEYAPAACAMLILYLIISVVSTGYGGYVGILLYGFWGYLDGLVRAQHKKQEK